MIVEDDEEVVEVEVEVIMDEEESPAMTKNPGLDTSRESGLNAGLRSLNRRTNFAVLPKTLFGISIVQS